MALALCGVGHASADNAASTAVAASPGVILPYGAMAHDANADSVAVLPYGAMTGAREATSVSVGPYGAYTAAPAVASPTAAILPYGTFRGHVAP